MEIPRGVNIEPKVRESFQDLNGTNISLIDSTSGRVVLETAQPWPDLLKRIESTGFRAALTGFGGKSSR